MSSSLLPSAFLSRRALLLRAGAAGLVGGVALGQVPGAFIGAAAAQDKPADVSAEELMQPGPLADIVIGKADAPVTIVEYASMTCGHCAAFHNDVLPELKKRYIETGKVRLIVREFPLDNLAAAGAMLARCAGDKRQDMIDALFKKQRDWVIRGNPVPQMSKIAVEVGMSEDAFSKCLTDQKLLDNIAGVRARAAEKFGVNSTPTFFVNGKRHMGAPTVEEFAKVIDPLLKS